MKIKFKEWSCIAKGRYYLTTNRKAIELFDEQDGEPIAVATINLPDEELPDDTVFIKNYSENSGMVLALFKAKIIDGYPLDNVTTDHVKISSYKLTEEALCSLWGE